MRVAARNRDRIEPEQIMPTILWDPRAGAVQAGEGPVLSGSLARR